MSARKSKSASEKRRSEPNLRHAKLCARLRFSLDETARLSDEEHRELAAEIASRCATIRRTGIRASKRLLPRVHRIATEVCERLLIDQSPEVYVSAAPELNAYAMTDATGAAFCVLNNGLIRLLSDEELMAVLSHEFGHAGLRHASRKADSDRAEVYITQRSCAGEISADRIALLATGSPIPLTTALIKIGCGLDSTELCVDIDAVLEQFTHPKNSEEDEDGPDSHPELPFRYWAMTRFAATDTFCALAGKKGGESFVAVEREIEDRFHALDEGLAFRITSDLVHEAIAWLGVMMVAHDDRITPREHKVLTEQIGRIWTDDVCAYTRRNGLASVERRAREVLMLLRHSSLSTRRRILEIVQEIGQRSYNHRRVRRTLLFAKQIFGKT